MTIDYYVGISYYKNTVGTLLPLYKEVLFNVLWFNKLQLKKYTS